MEKFSYIMDKGSYINIFFDGGEEKETFQKRFCYNVRKSEKVGQGWLDVIWNQEVIKAHGRNRTPD